MPTLTPESATDRPSLADEFRQADAAAARRHISPTRRAVRRFLRNRLAVVALVLLVLLQGAAIVAPVLTPHNPEQVNLLKRFARPSAQNLLGADEMGRDISARLLYGGRVSLLVGLSVMAIAMIFGTIVGAVSGYGGGWWDTMLMRFTDAMLSFPLFFFMLTLLALFGSEVYKIVLVIAAASWMQVARVVRAEALRTRSLDFVLAARCLGGTDAHIIRKHVVPQSVPSIIVAATLTVAAAILTESALSYLGLGVRPPIPSWGNMLSNATSYMWQAPWLAFYPGAAIFLVVLLYNALGDGIRDAFDPTSGE